NARALAALALLANKPRLAEEFGTKAAALKRLIRESLWDADVKFFKVRLESEQLSDAREEIGFIPWLFDLPGSGEGCESAWSQLTDAQGFRAPFGITTAERRHPQFRSHGLAKCEWDGAVWPFATSQTLNAFANVLRDQRVGQASRLSLTSKDYFSAFLTYVHSQHADGKPYVGEYLDEVTGDWINGKNGRSRYYNHSTFADLLITGVVGLRPRADDTVEVFPLLPDGTWDWFCLDGVRYHGHMVTVIWDKDGTRYQRGMGLRVLANGKQIAQAVKLERITGKLP
ncbi:MAG TPA: glycosyl hydrolase family 65 protein, partial [Verrucomicrobiae bacterium]|nr:glycosyl hydrolase family 65 protein [Verrucomicrobiae bacterium]